MRQNFFYICNMDMILSQIGNLVNDHFGVELEIIRSGSRRQRVTDARTIFVHAVYSNRLLNGVKLASYLNCTSTNVYYHLQKYQDLRQMKVFPMALDAFEMKVKGAVKAWRER